MSYNRVLPRDLFNEGKLLTELGYLSLAIHNNIDGIANLLTLDYDDESFNIELNADNNTLYVTNVMLLLKHSSHEVDNVELYIHYNSRAKNALYFEYIDNENGYHFIGQVFDGEILSQEFVDFLAWLSFYSSGFLLTK